MNLNEAKLITGHKSGLGKPGKMPGYSTAISAKSCKVGSKLAKVKGSVCSKCYALRGNYTFPVVKESHKAREAALSHPQWVEAMTLLISHYTDKNDPYFRVHDSGDLQDENHLQMWIQVARNLPWVYFWVPTKESSLVKRVMSATEDWPENLTIRISAPMIGQSPPASMAGYLTSTVQAEEGEECRAYTRGNRCGPCRACWDQSVSNVDYHAQ